MENIYADIAKRTGGNIYVGVVGPVRTGKSTLIKRIMEKMVIPGITDPYRKERARDELPQSGSGKTIMTSEPKFIPDEAVEICPDGKTRLRVRMIDSVGYMVEGAVGAEEDGMPRMVATPWYDYEIPLTEAAELGTKKVMQEHCSIGLVVTTDGSVTDIPRQDYLEAEARAVKDMQATGKPFLVIVNSREPGSPQAQSVRTHLAEQFGVDAVVADCQALEEEDVAMLLEKLLYAFPLQQINLYLPRWMDALEPDHPVKSILYRKLPEMMDQVGCLREAEEKLLQLKELPDVVDVFVKDTQLGTGTVRCTISFPEEMFYGVLSEKAGQQIANQGQLLQLLAELSAIRKEYSKVADALASVKATGYGIVMPDAEEMTMQTPEIVRKGGTFGVKLKAGAPSIHMIRVDVDTQISPMVGGEQQSQELVAYLTGEDPDSLWQSNIFGKSVFTLIQEGLTGKLLRTPEDVRTKIRGSLTKIVNEGANGMICLIL